MRNLFLLVLLRALRHEVRRLVAEQRERESTALVDFYLAGGPKKVICV